MSDTPTEIAPDGSIVHLLARTSRTSVIHCSLPARGVSRAVRHQSVEEIWYCLRGSGRLWRGTASGLQTEDALVAGSVLTIAPATCFQFRNDGAEPLEILIVTIPPWPGNDEARACEQHWVANV
jgi:mannose-6-phosphate isomerase-like protein (cupin superfamily)